MMRTTRPLSRSTTPPPKAGAVAPEAAAAAAAAGSGHSSRAYACMRPTGSKLPRTIVDHSGRAALRLRQHNVNKVLGRGHRLDGLKVVLHHGAPGANSQQKLAGGGGAGRGASPCGSAGAVLRLWQRADFHSVVKIQLKTGARPWACWRRRLPSWQRANLHETVCIAHSRHCASISSASTKRYRLRTTGLSAPVTWRRCSPSSTCIVPLLHSQPCSWKL